MKSARQLDENSISLSNKKTGDILGIFFAHSKVVDGCVDCSTRSDS